MKKTSVSTVIVTWNSADTIENCLGSLATAVKDLRLEVVVVDNVSSDGTDGIIKTKFPNVKLIRNKKNVGYGTACNHGLKMATGEFVFLLNPDTEVLDDSLKKMLDYIKPRQDIGVLAPTLVNQDNSLQIEVSSFPSLSNQILILLRLHRLPFFKKVVYPDYEYEKVQELEHIMGSAILVRKEVLTKVDFFDENFFLWFEDTDLLKRIASAGYKIVYFPNASVLHIRSHSIRKLCPLERQIIWNKSLRYYFKKHRPRLEQILLEPFIALSYLPAFLQFAVDKLRGRVL